MPRPFVIPGNDDAVRAVKVVLGVLGNAIAEANGGEIIDYVTEEDKKAKKEVKAKPTPKAENEIKPEPTPKVEIEVKPKKEEPSTLSINDFLEGEEANDK